AGDVLRRRARAASRVGWAPPVLPQAPGPPPAPGAAGEGTEQRRAGRPPRRCPTRAAEALAEPPRRGGAGAAGRARPGRRRCAGAGAEAAPPGDPHRGRRALRRGAHALAGRAGRLRRASLVTVLARWFIRSRGR